jgi:hypothetical protein
MIESTQWAARTGLTISSIVLIQISGFVFVLGLMILRMTWQIYNAIDGGNQVNFLLFNGQMGLMV